jgi:hypothetical protein
MVAINYVLSITTLLFGVAYSWLFYKRLRYAKYFSKAAKFKDKY